MWQTSDYALPEIVKAVSDQCTHDNRCYSVRYQGGTLMGTSSWYDPDGTYHYRDPNQNRYEVWCSCGRKWHVTAAGSHKSADVFIYETVEIFDK